MEITSINYDVITSLDQKKEYYGAACFSAISYNNLKDYKIINFYTPVEGLSLNSFMRLRVTIEDVKKYVKLLQKIGFVFDVDYNATTEIGRYENKKTVKSIKYTIDCTKNSCISMRLLLNLLRHTYEDQLYLKVYKFLELYKESPKSNLFSMLMLSCMIAIPTANHSLGLTSDDVISYYDKNKFEKFILNGPDGALSLTKAGLIIKKDANVINDFKKLNQEKNYKELLKYYRKNCNYEG